MGDMKMVDGQLLPLTIQEQSDHDARTAAGPALAAAASAKAALPDLATQVANLTAFVAKGTPLPSAQITVANAQLIAVSKLT